MPPDLWLICTIFAAFFGACIGSFLNVCIYRIPLDQSVVAPRSHCFACGKTIPWYHNLPVVSYFVLRGRCYNCKAPFSVRYALVELLTALLFVLACVAFPPEGQTPLFGMIRLPSLASVPVLWVFMSGLVIGTFVDFDHFILPDSVTIGGTAAGLVFSALLPELHGEAVWWRGLMMSGCGAVAGFAVLFAIAEIGKLTFGRKRVVPPEPLSLSFSKAEDAKEPSLRLGDEDSPWEELFWRRTDRWLFECDTARLDVREWHGVTAVLHSEGLRIGDEQFSVDEVESFEATVKAYTFPREAMGFGDVKLMAAIGAFWGWQSTLFTVMAAALLGTVVGVALIVLGKRQLGSRLPFGPYLAMGSLLWVFWGSRLLEAYMMMYK